MMVCSYTKMDTKFKRLGYFFFFFLLAKNIKLLCYLRLFNFAFLNNFLNKSIVK